MLVFEAHVKEALLTFKNQTLAYLVSAKCAKSLVFVQYQKIQCMQSIHLCKNKWKMH